ncbi:MAG TPA: NUDIX domain-containing protein [Patescibacteria group bacterium]|nr:NUDIX domain-containing protein [Patescibacteria group bacterium]
MKLLKHIEDKPLPKEFTVRFAVRAVLFDDKDGLIPLLYVSKFGYHKLPGGGIKNKEDKMKALNREVLEETGVVGEIEGEVGEITEYRSKWNLFQTSYCYFGKVKTKGKQSYTSKETREGFKLVWLSLDEAIDKLESDNPTNYEGKFIQERDLRFLQEVKKQG